MIGPNILPRDGKAYTENYSPNTETEVFLPENPLKKAPLAVALSTLKGMNGMVPTGMEELLMKPVIDIEYLMKNLRNQILKKEYMDLNIDCYKFMCLKRFF